MVSDTEEAMQALASGSRAPPSIAASAALYLRFVWQWGGARRLLLVLHQEGLSCKTVHRGTCLSCDP